ncbi:DUF4299 domain-containing protein [Erysipelotrichaceae bacterium OttesenSCG-928-M19]|nr:DUF4299 domain-containing protein [Erysipelotrichaceae bacterium OttesenSCG-928-M19]
MGIDITISKKGLFNKALDINSFIELLDESDYIILAGDFISEEIQEGMKYQGEPLIVYDSIEIGRGFQIILEKKEIFLRLPFLCTNKDIELFYKYTQKICEAMNITKFVQDGDVYRLEEINNVRESAIVDNRRFFRDTFFSDDGEVTTIFAAYFPINIETAWLESIKNLDTMLQLEKYAEYLNDKQRQDVYYARNLLYELKSGKTIGIYALTQGVASVVPKEALDFFTKPDIQYVAVVQPSAGDDEFDSFEVLFDDFKKVIDLDCCPQFDEATVIVELTSANIEKLRAYRCEVE